MQSNDHSGVNRVLVPNTVLAYRWWVMNPQGTALHSINQFLPWIPNDEGINNAECYRHALHYADIDVPNKPSTHEVPDPHCTCGIYARYFPDDLDDIIQYIPDLFYIRGVIEVSGNVELGTRGLRAGKAKVLAISPMNNTLYEYLNNGIYSIYLQTVSELAFRYGIKCHRHFHNLALEYPPSNLSSLIFGDEENPDNHIAHARYEFRYKQAMNWLNKFKTRIELDTRRLEYSLHRERYSMPMISDVTMKNIIKNLGV